MQRGLHVSGLRALCEAGKASLLSMSATTDTLCYSALIAQTFHSCLLVCIGPQGYPLVCMIADYVSTAA